MDIDIVPSDSILRNDNYSPNPAEQSLDHLFVSSGDSTNLDNYESTEGLLTDTVY